eukprot:Filipodium_phascolosomae@DN7432_c0_g1_i1.p1
MADYPLSMECYEEVTLIHQGAHSKVAQYRVRTGPHKDEIVAMKSIRLENFPEINMQAMRDELNLMCNVSHKNIVPFKCTFTTNTPRVKALHLVMDLVNAGSCSRLLAEIFPKGIKDIDIVAHILHETALALQYLHENQQIHRDVKAGNILLTNEGDVFLSDFGVAASLKDEQTRTTFVGTPCWMAPEVLVQSPYNHKADVWSFGITALQLANGQAPLQTAPPLKVLLLVMQKAPPCADAEEYADSMDFVELVRQCLQKGADDRPSISEVLSRNVEFFNRAAKGKAKFVEHIKELPPLGSEKTLDMFGGFGEAESAE